MIEQVQALIDAAKDLLRDTEWDEQTVYHDALRRAIENTENALLRERMR